MLVSPMLQYNLESGSLGITRRGYLPPFVLFTKLVNLPVVGNTHFGSVPIIYRVHHPIL